jgi:DUF305 family protein family protein
MKKMMVGMAVQPTGDIDRDFVSMMVAHHQGAIDMALGVLRYGDNEQAQAAGSGNHRHPAAGDRGHALGSRRTAAASSRLANANSD